MRSRLLRTPRLAFLAVVLACSDDDVGGPAPDAFNLTVGPATLSVLAGSTRATQVSVARLSGFTGDIELAAENVPPGIEVVVPRKVSASRPTATMYVVAAVGATGTKSFSVRAKAPGKADKTAEISVTVSGESAHLYSMNLESSALTIQRGLAGSVSLSITRNPGFTAAVPFECSNVPEGVHVYPITPAGDFNNPVEGPAHLYISVALTAYPTTYFLKCYGLVTDVAVDDVELRLVVVSQPLLGPPARRPE